MYSKIMSSALRGIDGTIIGVEADIYDGLPTFTMVGYLSSSVKESGERVKTALRNSGYHLPPKRIVINLSPADLRKDGSGFDLPIAFAILMSMGIEFNIDFNSTLIMGELGLDGEIRRIPGVLPMVHYGYKAGYKNCIVPLDNAKEAAMVDGINVYGVKTLSEAIDFAKGEMATLSLSDKNHITESASAELDFSDIMGQESLKRGMEIAAAGFHNVLMNGACGSGKSMLAKRLPGILPPLTHEESIEVTKIYSVCGLLSDNMELIRKRPFRSPHHTISANALVGGGTIPKPGEISLAHHGVLFLDEFPEFSKKTLEVMRQPMEDNEVVISRVNSSYTFPSKFMLVAAMNPCPCGYFPDMNKCTCTPSDIKRYQEKISGPLMDRIDINMTVKKVPYNELFRGKTGVSSKEIRNRVYEAIKLQNNRYKDEDILFNSELDGGLIKKYIKLDNKLENIIKDSFETFKLSARGTHKILKLTRTIADLDGSKDIKTKHLEEAIFYRNNGFTN